MLRLATDPELRERQARNARVLGERYRWTNNVRALHPLLENPSRWRSMRAYRATPRQLDLHEDTQALLLRRRGLLNEYGHLDRMVGRIRRSRLFPVARWTRNRLRGLKRRLRRG